MSGKSYEADNNKEIVNRISAIFQPYATEKMTEQREKKGRFVHYTSAESALSIIRTKRLWMKNATAMADFSEVQHGFDMLQNFMSDQTKRAKFKQALDACCVGVLDRAIQKFSESWPDYRLGTYIASISEHDDEEDQDGRLSMWRAFGASTSRVALVFKVPSYVPAQGQLGIMFSPVAYLRQSDVDAQFETISENVRKNTCFLRRRGGEQLVDTLFDMLISAVLCLKHRGFHEEREWRVIYNPSRGASPLIEHSIETMGGVPQTVHKLPLDRTISEELAELDFASMFDRLIIGPSPYPSVIFEALAKALMCSGVNNAGLRVSVSDIPIRPS